MRRLKNAPLLLHHRERGSKGGFGGFSTKSNGVVVETCANGWTTTHGKPNLAADSARGRSDDGMSLASTVATTVLFRTHDVHDADADAITKYLYLWPMASIGYRSLKLILNLNKNVIETTGHRLLFMEPKTDFCTCTDAHKDDTH